MNIYVGNLSFDVNTAELEELFSEFGEVASAKIISDRDSGRSRGFGFVEMAVDSEAKEAIEALNGQDFNGRKLVVTEARPKESRDSRPSRGGDRRPRRDGGGGGQRRNNWGDR
jgi:RNA recognition motif-containing protein